MSWLCCGCQQLPPTLLKHRVPQRRKGRWWSPITTSQEAPAWPRLSSSRPSWERRGKQGAFLCCGRARLASRPVSSTPRGRDAARLGWWVLPWGWGTSTQCHGVPIPAVPAGGGGYCWDVGLGFPVITGYAEPWHGFLATSERTSAAHCFLWLGEKK